VERVLDESQRLFTVSTKSEVKERRKDECKRSATGSSGERD
jgi:hypothetical protein